MGIKKVVLTVLLLTVLIACSKQDSEKLSVNKVVEALESHNLFFTKSDKTDHYFRLNDKDGHGFKSGKNKLYIYVFDNKEEQEKGLKDFEKQTMLMDMIVPRIYQSETLLIFYVPYQGKKYNFDKQIHMAVEGL
jgi:hypothetical protein